MTAAPASGCQAMTTSKVRPCSRLAVSTLHAGQAVAVEESAHEVFLVVVRDADGDVRWPQRSEPGAVLAGHLRAAGQEPVNQFADDHGSRRVRGQHRRAGEGDMGPAVPRRFVEGSVDGGKWLASRTGAGEPELADAGPDGRAERVAG